MTEVEAKAKWCPMAANRAIHHGDKFTLFIIGPGELPSTLCVASACMAWQWHGYRAPDGKWVKIVAGAGYADDRAEGFCGLAGRP